MVNRASLHMLMTAFGLSMTVAAVGCADKPAVKPPEDPSTIPTPPPPGRIANQRGNVGVSEDLAQACKIQFGNVDRAPKFDFEQSQLTADDQNVIREVAKCVTAGPLHGHAVKLVGHADPRGEAEYNMSLGENRADAVRRYLMSAGVASNAVSETSRGKIDAQGTDESSWRLDRRVDILLQ